MKIDSIEYRNFKSLAHVSVDLERLTILVGPNASGKSSILQGLNLLCRASQIASPTSEERDLLKSATHSSMGTVELLAKSGIMGFRLRARSPAASPDFPTESDNLANGYWVNLEHSSPVWAKRDRRSAGVNGPKLPTSFLLRLEGSKLINPAASSDPTTMSPDGSGLHSALASTALNEPETWQQLQANLRQIIPSIRRLRFTKTAISQPPSLLFDTAGAESLTATQISEGTLLVLGLLAALHSSGRPSLMLLDDLDRGLHPKAQKELVLLLRALLHSNPELQIVATTHSPFLLDCVQPNEVRMTFLTDEGVTVCSDLVSHPSFEKWRDEMTPGEMWTLFGEKWLSNQGESS